MSISAANQASKATGQAAAARPTPARGVRNSLLVAIPVGVVIGAIAHNLLVGGIAAFCAGFALRRIFDKKGLN